MATQTKAVEKVSFADADARIADRFITAIKEGGVVPWRKGWTCNGVMPANAFSKRPYRGINSMWLGLTQEVRGYASPYWTTNRAAYKAGVFLKPGEKANDETIFLIDRWSVEDKNDPDKRKTIPILKSWKVYNTDQFEDFPIVLPERPENRPPGEFESWLFENYAEPPRLQRQMQDRAYYAPISDLIVLPLAGQFQSAEAEAETLAHEVTHSTGHPSRLARLEKDWREEQNYAFEELVAEIGAATLMQQYGIEPNVPQMADYVRGWLRALEDDHSLIRKAAGKAAKAADLVRGVVFDKTAESDEPVAERSAA
jgi:antirestriction protein ArdC